MNKIYTPKKVEIIRDAIDLISGRGTTSLPVSKKLEFEKTKQRIQA